MFGGEFRLKQISHVAGEKLERQILAFEQTNRIGSERRLFETQKSL